MLKKDPRKYFIWSIFRSKYCILALVLGLVGGYYLIPEKIFHSSWYLLGFLYAIIFSIVSTCIIKIIKEKALNMKKAGAGIISILAAIFGIGAMQVCGIGAPICGATIGAGIFSLFFPNLSLSFLNEYAVFIIIFSIGVQLAALYYMKCFKKYLSIN